MGGSKKSAKAEARAINLARTGRGGALDRLNQLVGAEDTFDEGSPNVGLTNLLTVNNSEEEELGGVFSGFIGNKEPHQKPEVEARSDMMSKLEQLALSF
jgi:hypothetical protein